mgnify:CR=1 FL=1
MYLSEAEGRGRRAVLEEHSRLGEFRVARAEPLTWKGADGWDIEGVLHYPVDYQPGVRYPLILQVHGGPHGRYTRSFNQGAQLWAARGYAVLQSNPRGSSGRTFEFSNANVNDWGGKDYIDIMNGVDWLAEQRGTLLALGIFVLMFVIYTANHPAGFTANVVQTASNKGVLLAFIATRPDTFRLERSAEISAPPKIT